MTIKSLFRKKIVIPAILVLLLGGFAASRITKPDIDPKSILTEKVAKKDIRQTVLATGQVVSETDLGLAFKASGFVSRVPAAVGARVNAGQILATLDQRAKLASLRSAQGALAEARANFQKVLEGARTEEVAVAEAAVNAAEVALQNAKKDRRDTVAQQQTLVDNAYRKLLNTDTAPIGITRYDTAATLTVTGTYEGEAEGVYDIELQSTGLSNFYAHASGLEADQDLIVRGTPIALGVKGLYLTFGTSGTFSPIDEWQIQIPNKSSSSYLTNYNAYSAAQETQKTAIGAAEAVVASSEAALAQRRAELELTKAPARNSEIEAGRAQLLSAEARVQEAQADFEDTVIRAPARGTITSVGVKPGEQAVALKTVIVLQDVENLYLEANVSEANISNLRVGQSVAVNFDALGPDKNYDAAVKFIDPASNSVSGVVNYQIKASLGKFPEVRPGLTANMSIMTGSRSGVLAIPLRAVYVQKGKKQVRVVTDPEKKNFVEVEVETGLLGDGGIVEITAGLTEGQEIITTFPTP